jgi:glycosyltransferase involved in cell wall biosynthesis
MPNRILFIGKFHPSDAVNNPSASAAGTIVQEEIISQLEALTPDVEARFIAMEPRRIWPRGDLMVSGSNRGNSRFIAYINLPVLKNIIFGIAIFLYVLRFRPKVVVQYNSYLFENIAMLLCQKFLDARTCLILQDVRVGSGFSRAARWHDALSNMFLRKFDLVIPITRRMAEKYKLTNYFVFNGGITDQGYELLKCHGPLQNIAVFAGALEPYNGIDRLIDFWVAHVPNVELHVFGRGSLSANVRRAAEHCINIRYHGFQSADVVMDWQASAKFNFCLRVNDGIDEELFFPSKFFNAACAPGILVVNYFKNLPDYMLAEAWDLRAVEKLVDLLEVTDEEIARVTENRRRALCDQASWAWFVGEVVRRLS